jgi:hypothetical protein
MNGIDWHLVVEIIMLASVGVGNAIVVHVSVAGVRGDIRAMDKRLDRLEKKDDKAVDRVLDSHKHFRKGECEGENHE